MLTTGQLLTNIKEYLIVQLDSLSKLDKIESLLGLIADKDGNIDAEQIVDEMVNNIINANPFKINTGFIGDIEIGGGNIKINIPLTDKKLVLNQNDLNILKETLISNK